MVPVAPGPRWSVRRGARRPRSAPCTPRGHEARPAGQVGLVGDVDEPAVRDEDRRRRLALHVGVLDADHSARREQPRRRSRSTSRIASSPSPPDHSARAGSWSRTSGATVSHASSGMYGGLATTTSTVPSSSAERVGDVAEPEVDAGARPGCAAAYANAVVVELDGVHRALRAPRGRPPARSRPSRCTRSTTTGCCDLQRVAASIAQPASTSVSGRGTNTPGPTARSR